MRDATAYTGAQPLRIPAAPRRVARSHRSTARVLCSLMLGGVVALILTVALGIMLGLWRFTVIDSGSMRPALNPGDIAVLTAEPIGALHTGQIVAFHPPGDPRLTVIHRVFSIRHIGGGVVIQTKGDANNTTDPWRARILGTSVWRETLKLPNAGYVVVWSQQRPVRFGVLIIIVTSILATLLGWIWRPVRR